MYVCMYVRTYVCMYRLCVTCHLSPSHPVGLSGGVRQDHSGGGKTAQGRLPAAERLLPLRQVGQRTGRVSCVFKGWTSCRESPVVTAEGLITLICNLMGKEVITIMNPYIYNIFILVHTHAHMHARTYTTTTTSFSLLFCF